MDEIIRRVVRLQQIGRNRAAAGDAMRGLKVMEDGLASYRASGQRTALIRLLCILADAHASAGNAQPARTFVEEATAMLAVTGERRIGADLDRVRSQICLVEGDSAAAELYLRSSLTTAHRENARWLVLRAAAALGALLSSTGRRDEAARIVLPILDRFDQGSDLPDLVRAREVLSGS